MSDRCRLYDSKGNVLLKSCDIKDAGDNRLIFEDHKTGKYGYTDYNGKVIIPPIYHFYTITQRDRYSFRYGFATVIKDGKHLYIDRFGNSPFDTSRYAFIFRFQADKYAVVYYDEEGEHSNLIDKQGKERIDFDCIMNVDEFNADIANLFVTVGKESTDMQYDPDNGNYFRKDDEQVQFYDEAKGLYNVAITHEGVSRQVIIKARRVKLPAVAAVARLRKTVPSEQYLHISPAEASPCLTKYSAGERVYIIDAQAAPGWCKIADTFGVTGYVKAALLE